MNKVARKILSIATVVILLISLLSIQMPMANAAAITAYPSTYAYVKPAPYWTCDPMDEFPASQKVTIIERDYDYFYVQYTRSGQTKRGYIAMSAFTFPDYDGYVWCNHTTWTPGYNNTGKLQVTYHGPTGSVTAGSIDADEGSTAKKPLLVLRYEGSQRIRMQPGSPFINAPGSVNRPLRFRRRVLCLLMEKIAML